MCYCTAEQNCCIIIIITSSSSSSSSTLSLFTKLNSHYCICCCYLPFINIYSLGVLVGKKSSSYYLDHPHVEPSFASQLFAHVAGRFRRCGERRFQRVQLFRFDCRPRSSSFSAHRDRSATDRRQGNAARAACRCVAAFVFRQVLFVAADAALVVVVVGRWRRRARRGRNASVRRPVQRNATRRQPRRLTLDHTAGVGRDLPRGLRRLGRPDRWRRQSPAVGDTPWLILVSRRRRASRAPVVHCSRNRRFVVLRQRWIICIITIIVTIISMFYTATTAKKERTRNTTVSILQTAVKPWE